MPPGGYGADPNLGVIGDVLRYLAEIGAGRISSTNADCERARSSSRIASLPTSAARWPLATSSCRSRRTNCARH